MMSGICLRKHRKGQCIMRKSRITSRRLQATSCAEVAFGDILPVNAASRGCSLPSGLTSNELAISRPLWANFDMEHEYWAPMAEVCKKQNITTNKFIENAVRLRPDFAVGAAVQMQILDYYRGICGHLPNIRPAVTHSLHESNPSYSVG